MEIKTLWQSQARCFVIAFRGMKAGAEPTAPSPSQHVTALVSSKCLVTADSDVLETLGNFILIAYTPQGEKKPQKQQNVGYYSDSYVSPQSEQESVFCRV